MDENETRIETTGPEAVEAAPAAEPAVDRLPADETAADTEALNRRLAEGFRELTQAMPGDFTSFRDVPEGAVRLAAEKGIGLYDALLRYRYEEERAARAEQQRAAQAAALSAGSLASGGDAPQPEAEAFARAFAQALA